MRKQVFLTYMRFLEVFFYPSFTTAEQDVFPFFSSEPKKRAGLPHAGLKPAVLPDGQSYATSLHVLGPLTSNQFESPSGVEKAAVCVSLRVHA